MTEREKELETKLYDSWIRLDNLAEHCRNIEALLEEKDKEIISLKEDMAIIESEFKDRISELEHEKTELSSQTQRAYQLLKELKGNMLSEISDIMNVLY